MSEHSQTEIWITAAKRGDRWAVAKLFTLCDRRLRARAEARMYAALKVKRSPEDILQETYLEVVQRIDRFQGRDLGTFVNWVCAILDHKLMAARRAAHCQARDIKREVSMGMTAADSYWDLLDNLLVESGTPSRVVRRQEAMEAMLASLSDLSEAQRQVIELRFLEGLSVGEVAGRLNKSEAAVVALTKRALKALRESMDRLGDFTRGS
jgi:RNA polymerase sigma-70 factor (ECF subfamily)